MGSCGNLAESSAEFLFGFGQTPEVSPWQFLRLVGPHAHEDTGDMIIECCRRWILNS